MNRRVFLEYISAATVGGGLLPNLCFAENGRFSLENCHIEAAKKASKSKNRLLKLLLPQGSNTNLEPLVSSFKNLSGTEIKLIEAPVDAIVEKMMLGGDDFDLALPATFGIPDLVNANIIRDLSEYAAQYEPAALQEGSLYSTGDYFQNRLYGYQTDGDAYLMFYNKILADQQKDAYAQKFGKALSSPSTWGELDQQMAFFHNPSKDQYGGALFRTAGYVLWEWWVRFHAKGLVPMTRDLVPLIDHDGAVEALEELIAVTQFQHPGAQSDGLFENWKAYSKGNIYANIGWGGSQKYFNSDNSVVKDRLCFSVTPGGEVHGELVSTPYFNWGWNYTVSNKSLHPEQAYLFSLFAVSPKMSTLAVRKNGYFDPFRVEHYDDGAIAKAYGTEFLTAHQYSMANSIPDFYLIGQGEYLDSLRAQLVEAMEGRRTAKSALSYAAKSWQRLNRKYSVDKQMKQWAYVLDRYPSKFKNAVERNGISLMD